MREMNKEAARVRARAKRYSSIRYSLTIVEVIYFLILLLLFQGLGISQFLVRVLSKSLINRYFVIPVYIFIAYLGYYLLNFPLDFYQSFILEHKFCLSAQKIQDWLKDQIKAGTISYIIAIILIEAFYYILKQYPHAWWIIVGAFWISFSLILAKLLPVIIIPLFFKYTRLSDNTLRERIINLAHKMQVRILNVFEIDLSKKSLKANAAFLGWGATKRILLSDTLKDKYSYDEIEVILAHEFAHYRLRHILKLILINSLATILSFYIIFKTNNYILNLFGLSSLSDIASFPVIVMYLIIFGVIMQPFQCYISRIFERNADMLALGITDLKEAFISMMEKLATQNLADRNPRPLIKLLFFDHPPVDERIAMAMAMAIARARARAYKRP